MKNCERAINELLKPLAATGLVYALCAAKNSATPFIVFQRIGSERLGEHLQGRAHLAQADIQIDVYANDYYAAKDLAATIESTLAGYRGTVYHGTASPQEFVRIAGVTVQGDSDLLDETDDPLLYRNTNVYTVTYEQ